MAKNGNQAGKRKEKMFSLSRYVRLYTDGDGKARGCQISGYRYEGDGDDAEKSYVNIWIKNDFSITRGRDGGYVLHLKIIDVDQIEKRKEEPKDFDDLEKTEPEWVGQ